MLLEKNLWVRQFLYNSAKRAIQIVKKSFQIKDINVRVSEVSSFDGFIYLFNFRCSSPVGYRHWSPNDISLGEGCQDKGTAIHEMGHTIGKVSGFEQ